MKSSKHANRPVQSVVSREAKTPGPKEKRIFWLGMHKILTQTEYIALQEMGYEVFRPPYLSSVVDQSAAEHWDAGNTTLPADALAKLSSYNFFYHSISPELAGILNEFFGTILVTINPDWLKSVLEVYHGKIIYRCYGQLGPVSISLKHNGCHELIRERGDFHFLPHAPECLSDEEPWLQAMATVVPYWLTSDVLALKDTWAEAASRRATFGLTCPNITNPYYQAHFRYLKKYFEERCFRYYGVQLEVNSDPNVVGTLSREDQLASFLRDSGYLYTYRERNVCYLPPIEMMIMGAPVLFMADSLLSRYSDPGAPGFVENETVAARRAKMLMKGDRALAQEIIASQKTVRHRYTPEYGRLIFEDVFHRILDARPDRDQGAPDLAQTPTSHQKPVVIFAHLSGYVYTNGQFSSIHGIPRVLRQFVRVLNDHKLAVVLTCSPADQTLIQGFFASACQHPDLVNTIDTHGRSAEDLREMLSPASYSYAVVPHYHLFPEANGLAIPLLAYIPDYIPHFFYGRDYFGEHEDHLSCGKALAHRAHRVLTNSSFSAHYLPDCKLAVPRASMRAFPLPFLGSKKTHADAHAAVGDVVSLLDGKRFVFYPTQPHPHKRLDLLTLSWILLNQTGGVGPVKLVLTTGELPKRLRDLIESEGLSDLVHLLPAIDDATLEWLFGHASCLGFSSELEGNFPTQVLEAVFLDCPVVCTDNPLITTELGGLIDFFQISSFGDVEGFTASMLRAITHRDLVLKRQGLAKDHLRCHFSYQKFSRNVTLLNAQMTGSEATSAIRLRA